ncbi:MAG TPA: 50S ribosomal protein L23 [Methanolinea sp.]|nr:50S ribosomal protein L23 [Methanolinea sp.]HRS92492.1 50S ribosomal protein L23 [Methanolinea sp.]HRU79384.1 50S ribosomal protein L23 [Methanolinea sp.]
MVLRYPYVTEKAMMMLENQNKLQFIVDKNATKKEIKREIERAFEQEVTDVSTMMTMDGKKKAVISFANEKAAEEILSRLGIM